jgi:hypothetical protein
MIRVQDPETNIIYESKKEAMKELSISMYKVNKFFRGYCIIMQPTEEQMEIRRRIKVLKKYSLSSRGYLKCWIKGVGEFFSDTEAKDVYYCEMRSDDLYIYELDKITLVMII